MKKCKDCNLLLEENKFEKIEEYVKSVDWKKEKILIN